MATEIEQHIAGIRELLELEDMGRVDVGIELARSLDEPSIYEGLLEDCSIDDEGNLVRSSFFSDIQYSDYALLNLVADAPERANLDKSLKRSNIKSLSLSIDDLARYVKRGIPYGEEDQIVDFVSLPVGLSNLTKLTSLSLGGCALQNVDALANCANLTSLELVGCDSLENVNFLANLTNLTDLTLSFRLADEQWEGEDMEIVGDSSIKNIDGLNNCTKLTSLTMERSDFLFDLFDLSNLSNLTSLRLSECGIFDNVDGLANLTNLTSLKLNWCDSLQNVDGLANLTNLTSLDLAYCDALEDVGALANLSKLNSLDLSDCHPIVQPETEVMTTRKDVIEYQDRIRFVMTLMDGDTNVLSDYKDSTSLDLSGCNLQNVDALANLTNLTSLSLWNSSSFTSLPVGLDKLTNLTSLNLSYCSSLQNVDGLAGCTKLAELDLSDCESLQNVDGLTNCTKLTDLNLSGCNSLQNVDGLANLTKLTSLDLYDCSSLPVSPANDEMTTRNEVAAYQEQIKKAMQ